MTEKKKKIRELHNAGVPVAEVAKQVGVSRTYAYEVIRGPEVKRRYFHPLRERECVYPNLRKWFNEQQMSRLEMAGCLGCETEQQKKYFAIVFSNLLKGDEYAKKWLIDRLLAVVGKPYEWVFSLEAEAVEE